MGDADPVEQQVLSELRMKIGLPAEELPDEAVKRLFAYQTALLYARIEQTARDILDSAPAPLRKLFRRSR